MATETEIERMIVRLLGDGTVYQHMLEQAIAATNQFDAESRKLTETERERNAMMEQGARVAASVENATEAYTRKIGELDKLVADGAITQETYNRAIEGYQDALLNAQGVTAELAEEVKRLSEVERERSAIMTEGAMVTRAVESATEKYTREIEKLDDLVEAGAVSQETYNRALEKHQDALIEGHGYSVQATEDMGDGVDQMQAFGGVSRGAGRAISSLGGMVAGAGSAISGMNPVVGAIAVQIGSAAASMGFMVNRTYQLQKAVGSLRMLIQNPLAQIAIPAVVAGLIAWKLHSRAVAEEQAEVKKGIDKVIEAADRYERRLQLFGKIPQISPLGPAQAVSQAEQAYTTAWAKKIKQDKILTDLVKARDAAERKLAATREAAEIGVIAKWIGAFGTGAAALKAKVQEQALLQDKTSRDAAAALSDWTIANNIAVNAEVEAFEKREKMATASRGWQQTMRDMAAQYDLESNALRKLQDRYDETAKSVDGLTESLEDQLMYWGKTADEIKLLKGILVDPEVMENITGMQEMKKMAEKMAARTKKDMEEGKRIIEEFLTPQEKFAKRKAEFSRLLEAGAFDLAANPIAVYERAVAGARKEMENLGNAIKTVTRLNAVYIGSAEGFQRIQEYQATLPGAAKPWAGVNAPTPAERAGQVAFGLGEAGGAATNRIAQGVWELVDLMKKGLAEPKIELVGLELE